MFTAPNKPTVPPDEAFILDSIAEKIDATSMAKVGERTPVRFAESARNKTTAPIAARTIPFKKPDHAGDSDTIRRLYITIGKARPFRVEKRHIACAKAKISSTIFPSSEGQKLRVTGSISRWPMM